MSFSEVDAIRFWIGQKAVRRSSIWKIWDHNGSIYIINTSSGGKTKLSLHPECYCAIAFDKTFWNREVQKGKLAGERKATVKWKRKRGTYETAEPAAIIQFPTDNLCGKWDVADRRGRRPQFSFPPAPKGQCVEIGLFFVRGSDLKTPVNVLEWGTTIASFAYDDQEYAVLTSRHRKFDGNFFPEISELKYPDCWVSDSWLGTNSGEYLPNLSLTAHNSPKDGEFARFAEATGLSARKR